MSGNYYQERWDSHLDTSFDHLLNPLLERGLSWLPWLGRDFKASAGRLFVVGESHYSNEEDLEKVAASKAEISNNPKYTREVVAEYPLEGYDAGWRRGNKANNPTFDNLHRALLRSDLLNPGEKEMRSRLWRQIAYYNLVQRPMDFGGGRRERPNQSDYLSGWSLFVQVVNVIRPRTCVFIGVEASNLFNEAMRATGTSHTPVNWGETVNGVYTRIGGSVGSAELVTNLIFLRHTSQYFSWEVWNEFLEKQIPAKMACLREEVLGSRTRENRLAEGKEAADGLGLAR